MTNDEYIAALERVKEMHAKTGEALAWILGIAKGNAYKAKKMPGTPFMTTRATK